MNHHTTGHDSIDRHHRMSKITSTYMPDDFSERLLHELGEDDELPEYEQRRRDNMRKRAQQDRRNQP